MRLDTSKETQCAEIAAQLRIEAAKKGLYRGGHAFNNPLDKIAGGIKREETAGGRARQILGLPLVFIVVLAMALYTLIPYLRHRYRLHQLQREYDEKPRPESANNTFRSLWCRHGFDEDKYDMDVCVEAYSKWVEVLYGKKVCDDLSIKRMVSDIGARQAKLNKPYYDADGFGGSPHFYFVPTSRTLLSDVNERLGEYCYKDEEVDSKR